MTDITKGGRGKKAPYESTHCRIPLPLKPLVEGLANVYKSMVGNTSVESEWLKGIEDAIARAAHPSHKPVNKNAQQDAQEIAQRMVQEYLESLGLEGIPVDERGKPKARYDQLAKFQDWLKK